MTTATIIQRERFRHFGRQAGLSLFITLIVLIAMTLTGVALVRSVQTTNLIAGNFAFRNSALHAGDVGIEKAFSQLEIITSGALDSDQPNNCATSGSCYYYALKQAVDSNGIPSPINWANVTDAAATATVNGDYTVHYVIDRLCSGTLPIRHLTRDCYSGTAVGAGSNKSDSVVFSSTSQLFFRVTVRVDGPRNTVSYVQTVFSH